MQIDLTNLLSNPELSRKDKVLLVLFCSEGEMRVKDITEAAVKRGLREAKKWNVSQTLSSLSGLAVKLPGGWSITEKGKKYLGELGAIDSAPTQNIKPILRKYASQINDDHVKQFAEEAISALEAGLLRSAVVLSWVGAVSMLYAEVLNNHIVSFNAEALHRLPKWKNATNSDGLTKMKEYDFLQVLASLSIIGKNVKDELEQCLKLRNSCGHPNSLKIGEHKVASHIEILILNVYSKYSI
ncbi:hypothetical protein [Marinagarivorans cellulosilyticus]|uniref:DUF4145 domain-containing protein n=1 Tax=Marinagarivorans cellulosilyticus TaxID=2721545 RepID=A0AAN1WLL9_9GAMM|nr:hypothetical protein [Marinagarivorans cellulosilyticus]BCD99849.1 hypothetical protein MARGE09_P4051 [Marinagarivorans cellulosilyticus]